MAKNEHTSNVLALQKHPDFANLRRKKSVTIGDLGLNETEIKQKLAIAEQDIQYNRIHTAEEVRQNLIN